MSLSLNKIAVLLSMVFVLTMAIADPAFAANTGGPLDVIVTSMRAAFSGLPGIIAVICYLFGIIVAISAILKLQKHAEDPRSNPLGGIIVRFLISGALLSYPTVSEAIINMIGQKEAGLQTELATGAAVVSGGLGSIAENLRSGFQQPGYLFALIAYLFGIGIGVWALFEFIKTADSPQQNPLKRPIMMVLTSSALLTLPTIIAALRETVQIIGNGVGGPNGGAGGEAGLALDQILVRVSSDLAGPLVGLLEHVCFIAGIAFALIGIFRLMKSAQDGPKAPWGMGTIGTFLTAAALLSLNNIMGSAQDTLFMSQSINTYVVLADTQGMDPLVANRVNQAIQAVFTFVSIVGWFSFVRGIFILRAFSEGNGQASMSAGFTHIIGGAIAVNLPALVDAVQNTLGLVGLAV